MNAYRCSKCGQFRDRTTPAHKVTWWLDGADVEDDPLLYLCPDCASEVIAPLEAIAKTDTA